VPRVLAPGDRGRLVRPIAHRNADTVSAARTVDSTIARLRGGQCIGLGGGGGITFGVIPSDLGHEDHRDCSGCERRHVASMNRRGA